MARSKKKKRTKNSISAFSGSTVLNLDALVQEAEALVDSFNYDAAELKLREILEIDTNHSKSLEMLSSVYIEQFKWQEAENLLKRCIEINPETGFTKYFSIAQLCNGLKSVEFYEKGIQILERELENGENMEPSQISHQAGSLKRSLSDAYCSIAEVFMTDCCFEEDAEEKCCKAIDFSIKTDPSNPDAYQCQASYQLVKGEVEEAKQSIQKSLSLWLPHLEELRDREAAPSTSAIQDTGVAIPSYESRTKTSKLLIELEMFSEASKILTNLLEEDDEVVEIWYLLGWLNYIREDGDHKKVAHSYFKRAKKVSDKLGVEDECVDHTNELLEELSQSHPISDEEEEPETDDYEEDNQDDGSDFSMDDDEM